MAGFDFDSTDFGTWLDVERDGLELPIAGGAPLSSVGVPGSDKVYFQSGTPQPGEVVFRCRVTSTTNAGMWTKLDAIIAALDTSTTEELQFDGLHSSRHWNGRWDHNALVPEPWIPDGGEAVGCKINIRFLVEPNMEDD